MWKRTVDEIMDIIEGDESATNGDKKVAPHNYKTGKKKKNKKKQPKGELHKIALSKCLDPVVTPDKGHKKVVGAFSPPFEETKKVCLF